MRRLKARARRTDLPLKTRQAIGSQRIIGDFFRFYMLMLLYESPKTGYELMVEINKRLGKKVSPSIVYPFLRTLKARGTIVQRLQSKGGRERKVNSLSPSGKAFCKKLFTQFTDLVSVAIEQNLNKCTHCGARVYKDTYFSTIGGKRLPFCCTYCASSYERSLAHSKRRK
jgi:DNA-binding PadR family transcriptional regulator